MQTLSTLEIVILIAVLSAGVSAATTFVVSYLIEWSVWRKGSKVHKMELSFDENEKNERFLKLHWGVIYIRDGRDDVVPKLSEREKWFARLKNKIIYFKGFNPKKAKIRFYRTLGCQFKCFVELDNLESYLFSWDDVPGNDSVRLLRYLQTDHDIDWAENAEISKSDDGKTIHIFKDENSAEIMIDEKKEKATLKISDGGTYDLKVKKENNKLNIYLELFTDLRAFLEANGYKEISKGKRYGRVWFIHNDTEKYEIVETSEGIPNNFLYPE